MSERGVDNAIRIAAEKLSAEVSVRIANSSIAAVAAHTGALVDVSPAQLAYDLGVWLTHLRYQESLGALDKALLSFFKTKTENLQLAEEVTNQFYKTLRETLGLSDKKIFSIFKRLADTTGVQDLYQVSLTRSRFEQAGARDAYKQVLNRKLTDQFGAQDLKAFALYKGFSETSSFTDASTRLFGKNSFEEFQLTELRINSVSKALTDAINVTDDVDGAASIQDDQEMLFVKQRADLGSVAESFAFAMSYVRKYSDNYQAQDKITFGFSKLLFDTGRLSDSKASAVSKKLADSFGSRDLLAKVMGRPITDNARVVDLKAVAFNAARTDAATLSDSGSLRSQSYCDLSYFLEDYVGTLRTF